VPHKHAQNCKKTAPPKPVAKPFDIYSMPGAVPRQRCVVTAVSCGLH